MTNLEHTVRQASPKEFQEIGELLVKVYSQLDGFPKPDEQPRYYHMLANIGEITGKPKTQLLVAVSSTGKIDGSVVYFGDMQHYGSDGLATQAKNTAGFRLLAVDPEARGKKLGKLLSQACVQLAKDERQNQMIIHTTAVMQTAWRMYEKMGFVRSEDLDFKQEELEIFGFRLTL
jgi:GNAT superfamily N-acetyltransferase